MIMVAKRVQLEDAWELAARLSALDRIRLLERIASTLEQDMAAQAEPETGRQHEVEIPATWTDEEVDRLLSMKPMPRAEFLVWLNEQPPEQWGDLRDDEDAAEYIHRMRRQPRFILEDPEDSE
jgi:hypothetical protein